MVTSIKAIGGNDAMVGMQQQQQQQSKQPSRADSLLSQQYKTLAYRDHRSITCSHPLRAPDRSAHSAGPSHGDKRRQAFRKFYVNLRFDRFCWRFLMKCEQIIVDWMSF